MLTPAFPSRDQGLRTQAAFKRTLRAALTNVTSSLTPLLTTPQFLLTAPTPPQLPHFLQIRLRYLPDIILAYNTVLLFAGHFISRENLLECMNLAVSVGESEELTDVFVEAGRVRELVDGLAVASRAILSAKERGAGKGFGKRRRAGRGESSEIWSVGPTAGRV
jgi:nuclear pore complex protein Nup107